MTKTLAKIDFKPLVLTDKERYETYLFAGKARGCEYSFANLYLWGEKQNIAFFEDHAILFLRYGKHTAYLYPLGIGDKKEVLDAILADARERGINPVLSGVLPEERETLEALYPGVFTYTAKEGSFDYVYHIDDLAELTGKKYHGKRNHLNRFKEAYPSYRAEPLEEAHFPFVRQMVERWYRERAERDLEGDYEMERMAFDGALRDYEALGLDGLVLLDGDDLLAVTVGSRLSHDTFDVHFEKACVGGAYTAINYEFSRYIREKYPEVRFLDREEDMGIEGLRRAKRSYHPHHNVIKYRARHKEEGHEDR